MKNESNLPVFSGINSVLSQPITDLCPVYTRFWTSWYLDTSCVFLVNLRNLYVERYNQYGLTSSKFRFTWLGTVVHFVHLVRFLTRTSTTFTKGYMWSNWKCMCMNCVINPLRWNLWTLSSLSVLLRFTFVSLNKDRVSVGYFQSPIILETFHRTYNF